MVVDIRTWVKNVVNQPPSVTSNDIIVPLSAPTMSAKAVLICRPNSHPFQERTLSLDQPVKVGRSVARARATPTNAIFDCKVLSRHHALLWYKDGKFYLQDTKSSNGTFVNNNRLSPGGFESVPHEVCSGDIVQFGVDVVENNHKITHGCIVATLKLYLHDGKEAKASHSLSVGSNISSVPLDELYKLNQYLQDALQREQLLETKLTTLYNLVEQAREATNLSWQAFIGEDRLLSRVEILESQLLSYSKNYSEDKMREELLRLQEDKNAYQNSAKESLRKLHQERLDAIAKLTALQQSLSTSEQEVVVYKEQYAKSQEDLQELAQRYSTNEQHEAELTSQLAAAEEREHETEQKLQELLERAGAQNEAVQEMHKQIEKLQHDKLILKAVIAELDKCTLNNCPVELKFKVDKVLSEGMVDDLKNSISKIEELNKEDQIDQKFEENDNHKENNVPLTNQVENKLQEYQENREMEPLLIKLQEELKQLRSADDTSTEDLETLKDQISFDKSRLDEEKLSTSKTSVVTLCDETVDNIQFIKKENGDFNELKQELVEAQNEILEKSATITKMSDEIENLLESSAVITAKINILENDLLYEKLAIENYKTEIEDLKKDLANTQVTATKANNEEKQMKIKFDSLSEELNKRPSVESFNDLVTKCADLELIVAKIRMQGSGDSDLKGNGMLIAINKLEQENEDEEETKKFLELEEELVMMKERYAESNEEKVVLNKKLEVLQREYYELTNRSHNIMFLYIAPLVFLVAYLLFSTMFS